MLRWHTLQRAVFGAALAVVLTGSQHALAKPGYLGIQMQELNEALLAALDLGEGVQGVLIADVVDESAAAKAGLSRGDVIVQVDGKDVETPDDVRRRIRSFDAGEKVTIEAVRDGKKQRFEVTLGEPERELAHGRSRAEEGWPKGEVMALGGRPMLGVELRELNADLGSYFGAESGLLVLEVREESAAAKAGLKAGDVIQSADGEKTTEVADLHGALDEKEVGDELKLEVLRERKKVSLTATIEESDEGPFGNLLRLHGGDGPISWRTPGAHVFRFDQPYAGRAPRVRLQEAIEDENSELREELESLREQIEELRSEMQKQREG